MKKLFLASYSSNIVDKVLELLPDVPEKLSLAFIPTARDPYHILETNDPEKEKLISMGFSVKIVDLKNKSIDDLRNDLQKVDVIFVAGGNTFYLLAKMIESGFDKLVKELIESGVVYIGSSAGSVVVGPDISIAQDLDDPEAAPNLKTRKGLGLVDFVVLPHFGEGKHKEHVEKIYKEYKDRYKIIPLTDKQAVLVDGKKYKIAE